MFIGQKAGNRSSRRRSSICKSHTTGYFWGLSNSSLVCGDRPGYFLSGSQAICLWRSQLIFWLEVGPSLSMFVARKYFIFYFYSFILKGSQDVFAEIEAREKKVFLTCLWPQKKTFILTGCRDISCCFCGYKSWYFDRKLGHLQPCLRQERIDVFDSKSRHLQPCL